MTSLTRSFSRSLSRGLVRRRWAQITGLLGAPLAWLVLVYLGSLAALLVTSFYGFDSAFTFEVTKKLGLGNFRELLTEDVYRRVTQRTVGVALAVTVVDLALAVPIAFYLAKIAGPRARRILAVAITLPLWASYLVKAYAWRTFLDPQGGLLRRVIGVSPGFGLPSIVLVLSYLWLPYAILPIYAGLDRLPDSLLEASSDLGGRAWATVRSVVIPLLLPALLAASIFTFSLSLGDYITVGIVGGTTQMMGNVIAANFGLNNVPLAAAFAVVPMMIMIVYLVAVKRTGALDNL
jgi:putative spermidine/putrescine transport system permease protein